MPNLDCGVALDNCELLELLRTTPLHHPHKGLKKMGFRSEDRPLERILYHFQQHGMQLQVRILFDKVAQNKAEFRLT